MIWHSLPMHVAANQLSNMVNVCALLLMVFCLAAAMALAPWRALRSDPGRIHLVAGGALACLLLWLLNIRIVDGLVLHLLGITTLTLVTGWSLTLIAASISLLTVRQFIGLPVEGYPVAWLLTVLMPATLTIMLARLLYRPGLRNPFFYMLGAGFMGGCLVVLADALLGWVLLSPTEIRSWTPDLSQLWPLLLLMMFSEGFTNGLCVSAIAVFFPHWLKTFDESFYIDGT